MTQSGEWVHQERFERELRFGATDVQSAMDLRDPDRLVLDYTRLMMGFVLFQPAPRKMLMIGLGGGSLPKFCHRHFPGTDMTVVEINPAVIALREHFDIPPDQPGFRVVQADGAALVAEMDSASFDVIFVDAFDADGMPPPLGSQDFYTHCARLLTTGGVMVCNLHELDIRFGSFLERIGSVFDGRAMAVGTRECGNSVVFARQGMPLRAGLPRHLRRPSAMAEQAWADIEADVHDVVREARSAREFA